MRWGAGQGTTRGGGPQVWSGQPCVELVGDLLVGVALRGELHGARSAPLGQRPVSLASTRRQRTALAVDAGAAGYDRRQDGRCHSRIIGQITNAVLSAVRGTSAPTGTPVPNGSPALYTARRRPGPLPRHFGAWTLRWDGERLCERAAEDKALLQGAGWAPRRPTTGRASKNVALRSTWRGRAAVTQGIARLGTVSRADRAA